MSISVVARKYSLHPNQLLKWRSKKEALFAVMTGEAERFLSKIKELLGSGS